MWGPQTIAKLVNNSNIYGETVPTFTPITTAIEVYQREPTSQRGPHPRDPIPNPTRAWSPWNY